MGAVGHDLRQLGRPVGVEMEYVSNRIHVNHSSIKKIVMFFVFGVILLSFRGNVSQDSSQNEASCGFQGCYLEFHFSKVWPGGVGSPLNKSPHCQKR